MAPNGHFTLNFHYYEQRFQKLYYILTVEPIYRIFIVVSRDQDQRRAEADSDLQNIWDPRKDCGSFVDERLVGRYIVGTLTNKAHIIYCTA